MKTMWILLGKFCYQMILFSFKKYLFLIFTGCINFIKPVSQIKYFPNKKNPPIKEGCKYIFAKMQNNCFYFFEPCSSDTVNL